MPRADRGALVLAAVAGASIWISFGTLAITSDDGARIGALPPVWLLGVLTFPAVALAWLTRLKTSEAWPLSLTAALWLPWVPVNVPAALLVWEGPLEIVIWVAAVPGVLVARFVPRMPTSHPHPSHPRYAPWIAAALVFVSSLAAWAALGDRVPDGDEPHYLIITQSLLRDGDLQIENNHHRGDYLEYHAAGLPPDYLRRGVNEQIYSIHAPGLSALMLPAFAVAGYSGAVVLIALLCAAGVALIWRMVFELTHRASAAWAASLALATSAPYFLHSFTIFPDPVGAVIVTATAALLVKLETAPASVRRWHIASAGVALALLPWLHTRFALVAGVAAVCVALRLLSRADRWSSVVTFVAAPAASAAAWFSFFWIVYGTPNPAAPYGGSRQNAVAWMTNGATGLLFDQQFGLLANAPVMVLAAFGFVALARRHTRLAVELLGIAAPYAAVVTSFAMWWGGWSAPARFLVAVLPLAAPALAMAWVTGGPAIRSVFVALTLLGLGNVVGRLVMFDGALLYNARNGYDLLLDWVSRTVNLPLAMPAVHRTGTIRALWVGSIWSLAGLAAVGMLSALFRKGTYGLAARWALTSAIALGTAAVAMTISWRIEKAAALTPGSSQVAFAARWQPELRPIGIEMPPLRRLDADSALHNLRLRSSDRPRQSERDPPLLDIPRLPAGVYRVIVESATELVGMLTVSIGSADVVFDQWSLDGVPQGETSLFIRLPTRVQSLVVRGNVPARSRIAQLALKPEVVGERTKHRDATALRAATYGRVRAFLFDEQLYMEPAGMWTRGNAVTKLLLTSEGAEWAEADLQAGPIETVVELRTDEWSDRLELTADERRHVRIPTGRIVTIRAAGAFRPVDHDPSTRDDRSLGVRLEFPLDKSAGSEVQYRTTAPK